MVFSTFADTTDANKSKGSKKDEEKCILNALYVGTGLNRCVKAVYARSGFQARGRAPVSSASCGSWTVRAWEADL